jgi:nicotinamide-nucleotide amidase
MNPKLEERVIKKLQEARFTLCTVESCTGGLISHLITNVSGASSVFWGSFVVYDNSTKQQLGVSEDLISRHGAVSTEVAKELAIQGLNTMENRILKSSSYSLIKPKGLICVSTTGIAGPTGGSKEKPIGLCFIGLAINQQKVVVEKFVAGEAQDRITIKTLFAQKALELVLGTV